MIRHLTSDDLPVVTGMLRQSFSESLWPYMPYTQHGAARYLDVAVRHPLSVDPRCLLVAADDRTGTPTGFADFRLGEDGTGFLSYICVDPGARGRGLASAMFEHFLNTHPGLQTIQLDTFRDNVVARAMYERWGFAPEGTSAWVTRALPPAQQPPRVTDLPVSLATHEAYGFCEVGLAAPSTHSRIGILGEGVIRCFSREAFEDDRLLASARALFGRARTAFTIVPETDLPELIVPHDVLLLSDRMRYDRAGDRP